MSHQQEDLDNIQALQTSTASTIGSNHTAMLAAVAAVTAAIVAIGVLLSTFNTDFLARNNIDTTTGARNTILYPHHEVHGGRSFTTCDLQAVDSDTIWWMITTADTTRYSHMIFDVFCTGEMYVLITEGADRTGTNALAEVNHRRTGTPNVATTAIHRAVSGGTTDGAIEIDCRRVGATGGGSKTVAAGEARGTSEFILRPNTKYVVRIITYADVFVTAHFDWYEHIDKN